jgi:hypothetical protein
MRKLETWSNWFGTNDQIIDAHFVSNLRKKLNYGDYDQTELIERLKNTPKVIDGSDHQVSDERSYRIEDVLSRLQRNGPLIIEYH